MLALNMLLFIDARKIAILLNLVTIEYHPIRKIILSKTLHLGGARAAQMSLVQYLTMRFLNLL